MNNFIGLYIHIPFCRSKCPYCDFFSVRKSDNNYSEYVKVLLENITKWSKKINKTIDTIYIGGGTPSEIGAENICEILRTIKNNFIVSKNCEITIEVNPCSGVTFDFDLVSKIGVNRVSVGLQSANTIELKKLGRLHTIDNVENTINSIKKSGINNISLDLMMGIPGQTIESLKNSIDFCVKSKVTHISSYILTLEKNTHFYKIKDKLNLPNEDETSDLYLYAVKYLEKHGFNQYEISNFSKTGFESRHNLRYWNLDDYLGIGPGAHSYIDNKRFFYSHSFEDFKNDIIYEDGFGGCEEEYIMLQLRLKSGLNFNKYKKAFGKDISKDFLDKVNKFVKLGYMNLNGDNINFTDKGFLLSNTILSELI